MNIRTRATLNVQLGTLHACAAPLIAKLRAHMAIEAQPPWYRFANADDTDRAKLYIYAPISDWDLTAEAFARELDAVTAPAIDLHINSPGGLVFDAVAIYSALQDHPATVDVSIDGLAASAASFVAMAGDTIAIQKPAKMFIHDALGLCWGNPADMLMMHNLLDELSDTIAQIYADRSGTSAEDWRTAMRANGNVGTWYGAREAVDAGLADRVAGDKEDTPKKGDDKDDAPEDRRSQLIRIRARARGTLGGV